MTQTQSDLIRLLRFAVLGEPLPEGFQPADAQTLFQLAKAHDLAHLASFALRENGLLDPASPLGREYDRQQMLAVWRVNVLERDLGDVCVAFEKAGIDYIPLKGAVIRGLYPEPWMRTSGDIDILVRADDLERAEQTLTDTLSYRLEGAGGHYHHVTSPSGFHIDLHFTLTELESPAAPLLHTVWERSAPVAPGRHAYRMPDALMYLFHVYHAAHHARHGSCGVRTVLDTWLLCHGTDFDADARRAMLRDGGLTRFADTLETVARAWFRSEPLSRRYQNAEAYFFTGGVYQGRHNLAAAQASMGGRVQYLFARAFPPRSSLRIGYPVLERQPWLLPACWAHRLVKAAAAGKLPAARQEIRTANQTRSLSQELALLFTEMGLSD